jgi:predicted MFS family arabinose efflux permease
MQVFENGFHVVALPRVSIASYTCLLHSMTPEAQKLWRAPQWAFSILLALLGMLGPFSIDTYLPAFAGISQSLGATPVQMQQTLSAYLFGFAFMALFHGSISDSFGRRPVVLWGLAADSCQLARHLLVPGRGGRGAVDV